MDVLFINSSKKKKIDFTTRSHIIINHFQILNKVILTISQRMVVNALSSL
jgi:hypothetical protein